MGKWFRLYTKVYFYHWVVIGTAGTVATVVYASPGEHHISVGSLQLDVFYASIVSFGLLFVLSVTDEYDPRDDGLIESKSGK